MTLRDISRPAEQTGRLIAVTVPWDDVPLTRFLRRFEGSQRVYWARESRSLYLLISLPTAPQFAGAGEAARLHAGGAGRFTSIAEQAEALFEGMIHLNGQAPAHIGPKLFGGFAFSPRHMPEGRWSAFGAAQFTLPRYLLTRAAGQMWLTVSCLCEGDTWETFQRLRAEIDALRLPTISQHRTETTPATVEETLNYGTWQAMVERATRLIKAGSLDKVVLSRTQAVRGKHDAVDALGKLGERYPRCYRFLFEPQPGHAFLGATPETLASVEGERFSTMALAGSAPRGETRAADEAFGAELLASGKNRREHALVAEMLGDALEPFAAEITVEEQPRLYKLSNIQHLRTDISGQLAEGVHLLDVVEALHPTPAVGGQPRRDALPLIEELEPHTRGWYAAPVGWLAPDGSGEFAVGIRSAAVTPQGAELYAGAGIVAQSDPQLEWDETGIKFSPMLQALGAGVHA